MRTFCLWICALCVLQARGHEMEASAAELGPSELQTPSQDGTAPQDEKLLAEMIEKLSGPKCIHGFSNTYQQCAGWRVEHVYNGQGAYRALKCRSPGDVCVKRDDTFAQCRPVGNLLPLWGAEAWEGSVVECYDERDMDRYLALKRLELYKELRRPVLWSFAAIALVACVLMCRVWFRFSDTVCSLLAVSPEVVRAALECVRSGADCLREQAKFAESRRRRRESGRSGPWGKTEQQDQVDVDAIEEEEEAEVLEAPGCHKMDVPEDRNGALSETSDWAFA